MSALLDLQRLLEAATRARQRAYAPYSGFAVGAAVQLRDGRIFAGVNVENSSYGLTVCAERHAIAAAVAEGGAQPGDVVAAAVVAAAHAVPTPCGACRQVLAEFSSADMVVILRNLNDGAEQTFRLEQLLPVAFSRDALAPLLP